MEVQIPINTITLAGTLSVPDDARGLIIFAHGSGSSRLSPRNRMVAEMLQRAGFGTLLFDLLTEAEDSDYANRFNIPLLAERLSIVTTWARERIGNSHMKFGYFGASTGAAAACIAATQQPEEISAIVSRGGRPDLASDALPYIDVPTLFIVGENDEEVIVLNRTAMNAMHTTHVELQIIPGATHLFEETGALERVGSKAVGWFVRFLTI